MMTSRLLGRRGDGSAAVRGWVRLYTLGLPTPMRDRRRSEVAGDLADETVDAVRRGDRRGLFRQRVIRMILGIPADLSWRLVDAPPVARQLYGPSPWVPLTRWTLALTGIVAVLAAGGLAIVTLPVVTGQARPDLWPGWGLVGFAIGSSVVFVGHRRVGVLAAPRRWIDRARRAAGAHRRTVVVGELAAGGDRGCGPGVPGRDGRGMATTARRDAVSFLERVDHAIRRSGAWRSLFRQPYPRDERSRAYAVMNNVFLHIHPVRVRQHAVKFAYTFCLGGLTFFLFLVLTVTGVYLMFFYVPSATLAYTNILEIQSQVTFGLLTRNIHRWGAHLMVFFVFLHMMRVFYHGAYKPPREFNWVVGVVLLFLTIMLSFSGYLLPWDQIAFWAITIGTNFGSYFPIVRPR